MWVDIKNKMIFIVFIMFFTTVSSRNAFAQLLSCPCNPKDGIYCTEPITSCCILDQYDSAYFLTDNITANIGTDEDCLVFNNNLVRLLCYGYTIIGNGTGDGINISGSVNSVINCGITNFTNGIRMIGDFNDNSIRHSRIYNNSFRGIHIEGANTVRHVIRNNTITNNSYGIVILSLEKIKIYDNYLKNINSNAYNSGGNNFWNTTKTSGTNIISSPYIGGNYWDDYTGDDTDGDGLGDTPYDIPGWDENKDYLPLVDINSSQYSNNVTDPTSPVVYSQGASYQFNITWTDNIEVDEVIIEFDGTNYTDAEKVEESFDYTPGQIEHRVNYSKTFYDLPVGTYEYRWYANDTRDNWNSTDSLTFTIEKASSSVSITISPSSSVTYPTETNASCSIDTGDPSAILTLYRNGTQVTNPDVNTLAANVYNYTCVYEESQNYTSSSSENFLTVNKASRTTALTFDPASPITYEDQVNASCSVSAGANDGTLGLFRNQTDVTSENGIFVLLPAGVWDYECNITEGENYTSATTSNTLTINKKNANVKVYPATQTQTYPYTAGQYCTDNSALLDCNIYRNDALITNGTSVELPAGVYNYIANITDTENYTNYEALSTLTIDKATPSLSLTLNVTSPIIYETPSKATGSGCPTYGSDDVSCVLHRDSVEVNNPDEVLLGYGTYTYNYTSSEGQNWTYSETTKSLSVDKKDANVQVYPVNQTIINGTSVLQYCTDESDLLDCLLYRNGTLIPNNTYEVLDVGVYEYVANISDDYNYTNHQNTSTLTVVECLLNADCDDGNECTQDICNATNQCEYPPVADETPCGDQVCDACYSGVCEPQTSDDGVNCVDDCTKCDNGICKDRYQCDQTECIDGWYCDSPGGDCRDPNENSQAGEDVCEICVSAQHNFGIGEGWLFEAPTIPYCCDNDPNEYYISTTIGIITYHACCNSATDCVDATGNCRVGNEGPVYGNCEDGYDNDCDGLIDGDDPDCQVEIHDVAITEVIPSTDATYPHEKHSANITITAKNEGTVTETFDVNAYYYNETISTEWIPIGTYSGINLDPGLETTFNITWNTVGVEPCYVYEIKANASIVAGETDTSDNTLIDGNVYVKILFDVNGDGIVDIVDVVIAAIAYGSKPGDPNWNPDADLNKDGIIDIVDVVMVAIHFGETC